MVWYGTIVGWYGGVEASYGMVATTIYGSSS